PSSVTVSDDAEFHPGMQCVWWQIAEGGARQRGPLKTARTIGDRRFSDRSDIGALSGELVVAPDQAMQPGGGAEADLHVLPYLTSTSLWDPAAAVILRECFGNPGGRGLISLPGAPDTVVVMVDADHGLGQVRGLMERVGVNLRIVDLRDADETGML